MKARTLIDYFSFTMRNEEEYLKFLAAKEQNYEEREKYGRCVDIKDWESILEDSEEENARKVIKEVLGMEPDAFTIKGYGRNGFDNILSFGNIDVMYSPNGSSYCKPFTVWVDMTGKGCRNYEKYSKLYETDPNHGNDVEQWAFMYLFDLLQENENANVTRLDLACDDFFGFLDFEKIRECYFAGGIRSKARARRLIIDNDRLACAGTTLYVGSPSSERRVRIYDKKAEQKDKGHDDIADSVSVWTRVELVLRRKYAQNFIKAFMHGENFFGGLIAEALNDLFQFVERDEDTNISRCPVCKWWADFLGTIEKVVLYEKEEVEHTVKRSMDWVKRQVMPSLVLLAQTVGWNYLIETIRFRLGNNPFNEHSRGRYEFLINDYNNRLIAYCDKKGIEPEESYKERDNFAVQMVGAVGCIA